MLGMLALFMLSQAHSASSSFSNSMKANPAKPVSTRNTLPDLLKASSSISGATVLFTRPTQIVVRIVGRFDAMASCSDQRAGGDASFCGTAAC